MELLLLQAPEDALVGGVMIVFLIIGLAINIAVIWGCWALAERKGYNAPLAAVMGFLFGILALLVYAILSDNTARRDMSYGGSNNYTGYGGGGGGGTPNLAPPPPAASRSCWSCGNAIPGNAASCPTCGIKLNF